MSPEELASLSLDEIADRIEILLSQPSGIQDTCVLRILTIEYAKRVWEMPPSLCIEDDDVEYV